MRVALLGGSFDPVHIGHLFVAEVVRVNLGYDRIVFVPAYRSPHKRDANYSSADHRLAMLRLSVGDRSDFAVSTWEIERGGVSYTVETVRRMYDQIAIDERLGLIIGDDLVPGFESWKSVDELVGLVDLIVANRNSSSVSDFARPHRSAANARLPISSTDIRRRVGDGQAYRYLVPDSVFRYIQDHGLYAGDD